MWICVHFYSYKIIITAIIVIIIQIHVFKLYISMNDNRQLITIQGSIRSFYYILPSSIPLVSFNSALPILFNM